MHIVKQIVLRIFKPFSLHTEIVKIKEPSKIINTTKKNK